MICNYCGAQLPDGEETCPVCGWNAARVHVMPTRPAMEYLSPQQRQNAENLFSQGLSCSKRNDFAGAARAYAEASEQYGHPGAMNNLGVMYMQGSGVPANYEKAFSLYHRSAEVGNEVAMRNLAARYEQGQGTEKNPEMALSWLMTAVEYKSVPAAAKVADYYGDWRHKDEKKHLFWLEKAAAMGHAGSLLALGNYYAADSHQDLTKAISFYDKAGRLGSPADVLKVAEAYEKLADDSKNGMDYTKAREWYIEASKKDDDKVKLAAAKAMDYQYRFYDGKLRHPPLDLDRACFTYRELAQKGNDEAILQVGYCHEIGKTVPANLALAIMYYRKSSSTEGKRRADWCQRKLDGRLADPVFEEHFDKTMPPFLANNCTNRKELYNEDVNFRKVCHCGSIYYLDRQSRYVCCSDTEGGQIRIIADLGEDSDYHAIQVNRSGIYVYTLWVEGMKVLRLNWGGEIVSRYEDMREEISWDNLCVCEDKVYFVEDAQDGSSVAIKCVDMTTEKCSVIYDKASQVSRLCASPSALVFWAKYETRDNWEGGWMCWDPETKQCSCLESDIVNPERILDAPELFDPDSPEYLEDPERRKIVFVDLSRNICWTERDAYEGEDSAHLSVVYYWEPQPLIGYKHKIIKTMPVWRVPGRRGGRQYFDGSCFYYAENYHSFVGIDRNGTVTKWGNSGHGGCDQFTVMDQWLFLDLEAHGEEQYELTLTESAPLRKSWFKKDLPQESLDCFYERGAFAKSFASKPDSASWERPPLKFEQDEEMLPAQKEVPLKPTPVIERQETPACLTSMRLWDFRMTAENLNGCREELLRYRKSLPEKWDYNVFVGILMSVRGPKHGDQACMNLAIGQGDNSKCTERRINEKGLQDLFLKYRGKKFDHNVTVAQVEDEILEIVPEYAPIRKFFDETVFGQKSDMGGLRPEMPASAPALEEKTADAAGEREKANEDLETVKCFTETDLKYAICTFGAKFHIGYGVPVTLIFDGKRYDLRSHNKVKGRFDGMRKFYNENHIDLGREYTAKYDCQRSTITLESADGPYVE